MMMMKMMNEKNETDWKSKTEKKDFLNHVLLEVASVKIAEYAMLSRHMQGEKTGLSLLRMSID